MHAVRHTVSAGQSNVTHAKDATCPICHNADRHLVYDIQDYMYGLPGDFTLNTCRGCGAYYMLPSLTQEELLPYYPTTYDPHQHTENIVKKDALRNRTTQREVDLVEQIARTKGRVLDVGTGAGVMLAELQRRGWEAYGIEPSATVHEELTKNLGLNIHQGDIETVPYPDQYFDVILFWHVLEHLQDARAALEIAARLIKPGGKIIINQPNPQSFIAKLCGRYWCGWEAPRHIALLPRATLAQLLKETGWGEMTTYTRAGRHWYLTLSMGNWQRHRYPDSRMAKMLCRVVASTPVRALTLPVYVIMERLGESPGFIATAHKR